MEPRHASADSSPDGDDSPETIRGYGAPTNSRPGSLGPGPGPTHGSFGPPTAYDPSSQHASVRRHSPAQPMLWPEQMGRSGARPPQQHPNHAIHSTPHPPQTRPASGHPHLHLSRQPSSLTTPAQHKPVHEQQQQPDPALAAYQQSRGPRTRCEAVSSRHIGARVTYLSASRSAARGFSRKHGQRDRPPTAAQRC